MPAPPLPTRYRFGTFEADATTGELRRQGLRIKIAAQPFQVLCLLLASPGELLTREAIARELWPDGTFVDFDHGVNSAVNRIREALGDTAASPRFIETLARRGYRFIAPVEIFPPPTSMPDTPQPHPPNPPTAASLPEAPPPTALWPTSLLASESDLPRASHTLVRTLFLMLQLMYLSFYIGALANLPEIDALLSPLAHAAAISLAIVITSAMLIPVRVFVLTMLLFRARQTRPNFLRLWPLLLPLDLAWSLSPFLLLHHIDFGLALACTALLVYSPFAQRALVLMGATPPNPDGPSVT